MESTNLLMEQYRSVTLLSAPHLNGYSVSYLESSGNASIQCPFVSMTTNSSFSDADVWTSSGVTNTEVRLREYEPAAGGDFIASYTPSTTVTGGVADHDWNTVTPTSLNYLVIFIDGAPNDRVYGYKFTDTALSY